MQPSAFSHSLVTRAAGLSERRDQAAAHGAVAEAEPSQAGTATVPTESVAS